MKLQRTCVLLVGVLLVAVSASARKWTDNTGKFSVEAELVEATGGNVRLKRKDGKIMTVSVSRLSKADRDYLASIAKAKKKSEAAKPTREEVIAAIRNSGGFCRDCSKEIGRLLSGSGLMEGFGGETSAERLQVTDHVECDSCDQTQHGAHAVDALLHLAMTTIPAFDGVGSGW